MVGRQQYVKCLYGRNLIKKEDSIKIGGFISGPFHFYMHKDKVEERKLSRKLFDQYEANCNTCIHLQRIKHAKNSSGFLYGTCKSTPTSSQYYTIKIDDSGVIRFHPEDPMFLPCYSPRNP